MTTPAWVRSTPTSRISAGRRTSRRRDDEALAAFSLLSRLEGIIPALEPSHALAHVAKLAPQAGPDKVIVMNLSGRGDKDLQEVIRVMGERQSPEGAS